MDSTTTSAGTTAPAPLGQVDGVQAREVLPVTFTLTAVSSGKRRNDVRVRMTEPWPLREWELASDEAPAHGGEETAPKPLGIFATGIATCFMTQVRTFSRACGVRVDGLQVEGRFEWQLKPGPRPRDPYTAETGVFHLDINMDTQSPMDDQQRLIAAAARGCFAEAVLKVPVMHRLKTDYGWVNCDVD